MDNTVSIKLTPTDWLNIIGLLSVIDLTDEAKPLFQKIEKSLTAQLAENSTKEQLEIALDNVSAFLDPDYIPQFIS